MLDTISPLSRTPFLPAETLSSTAPLGNVTSQIASVSNASQSVFAASIQSTQPANHSANTLYALAKQRLEEKITLYKEYLSHGNNPENVDFILKGLESELATIPQVNDMARLLTDLKYLACKLRVWQACHSLTQEQRVAVNKRQDALRTIIKAYARLPDLLLKTDLHEQNVAITAAKKALTEELVESTLRRLLKEQENEQQRQWLAEQIRQQLNPATLAISVKEKVEYFYASGVKKLQQPLYTELAKEIEKIKTAFRVAQHLISWSDISNDTGLATSLARLTTALESFWHMLERRLSMMKDSLNRVKKPVRERDTWLSREGVRLSVPGKKLANTVQGLPEKLIKNEKLKKLITPQQVGSFIKLTDEEKQRCLALKKMAAPVRNHATQLQKAAKQLKKTIDVAIQNHIKTLPESCTPETALFTELMVLTENTPQTRLIEAIHAAKTLAWQVLSEPPLAFFSGEKNRYAALVQELNGTLDSVAASLRDAALLAENNFCQQSLKTSLCSVEKKAGELSELLDSGLESATGIASAGGYEWIDKVQVDIRNNWHGITGLLSKGSLRYPVISQESARKKALCVDIHLAVLPLLNEAEKLRKACRRLEIVSAQQDYLALETIAERCRSLDLEAIQYADTAIQQLLDQEDIPLYQRGDEYSGHSVTLGRVLSRQADNLVKTGSALQQASWFAMWMPGGDKLKLLLLELRSELDSIKKSIKDSVYAATELHLHNNPPEGMIAKDAGEWLAELKKEGVSDSGIQRLLQHLSRTFSTEIDPQGKLFRKRVMLAMSDAERGQIPWPLTADEHLAGIKTQKDYTFAWAEKRLTYGVLYNLLIHGTPAGMLSLYKTAQVSPLRLINLLLTPIRMALTCRGIEKVKPGAPRPREQLDEHRSREVYQASFRLVSMLMPQLPKTLAAIGIATWGLAEGGEYRIKFLQRAVSRLPGDLFWIAGFALWRQVSHSISGQINPRLTAQRTAKQLSHVAEDAVYPVSHELREATVTGRRNAFENKRRVKRMAPLGGSIAAAARDNPFVKSSLAAKKGDPEPEKSYTKEEVQRIINKALLNYNYIDTGKAVINYSVIDNDIDQLGVNSDGTLNEKYLMDEAGFKELLQENLLQVVGQHDINNSFHHYIKSLQQKILSHNDTQYMKEGKVYIKVPIAISYMHNSILNHIRAFDNAIYYSDFDDDEILKFTQLKNTHRILRDYMLIHYDEKITQEIKKIDDGLYHTWDLNETEQYQLLDYITQPYLNKNSECYRNLFSDIKENHYLYDTQHIISNVYNKVIDEVEAVLALPLPFMAGNSETGKYIDSLTQVLKQAQRVFGGLYYYDHLDSVNTSLAKEIRDKIKKTYALLSTTDGNNHYDNELKEFIAVNNNEDGKKALINKYRSLINAQLNSYLQSLRKKSLVTKPEIINNTDAVFIAELQRLVAQQIVSYPDKQDPLYQTLNEFSRGKLSKQQFKAMRKSIIQYIIDETFKPMLTGNVSDKECSLLLLSKISDVDLAKINEVSESKLLSSGEFSRLIKEGQAQYTNKTIQFIEYGIRLLALDNPDEIKKAVINSFTNGRLFHYSLDDFKVDGELIIHEDLDLVFDFISSPVAANEDIESLSYRVVKNKVIRLEKERKDIGSRLYKMSPGDDDFVPELERLKKVNVALLNIRRDLKERFEVIKYVDDIVDRCHVVEGKFVSNCLPEKQSDDELKNIEDAKIAAIKHYYKLQDEVSEDSRIEYLNVFNAHIAGDTPDAYHLKNLSALYWGIFYHSSFNSIMHDVLPYFGTDEATGERKKFGDMINNHAKLTRIKTLTAYMSTSRLNTLMNSYVDVYNNKEIFSELLTNGETLPGTYFSIADIKKRSEIPGHSLEDFSAQFSRYGEKELEADATVIVGQHIRKSGIDIRQLALKPKAVYSYQHVGDNHQYRSIIVRDRTKPQPKESDVLIVVTQNNSMLLSLAYGNQSAVYYLPPLPTGKEPTLAQFPVVLQDLAPVALDYQFKDRDKPEHMDKCRSAVANGMKLFYHLNTAPNYSFKEGMPSSDHLVLNADALHISADRNVYSWGRKNLILLEKTNANIATENTVQNIFHQQIKGALNEKVAMMKEIYNDHEDITGEVLNALPLPLISVGIAARKLIDEIPLNDADIGMMIADVIGVSDLFASGVNSVRKLNLLKNTRADIARLQIHKDKPPAVLEAAIENMVRDSLNTALTKDGLSSYLPVKRVAKPRQETTASVSSDLKLSRDGQFLSSRLEVPLSHSDIQADILFKNAKVFADNYYYNELKNSIGKNKLDALGIQEKAINTRNMYSQRAVDTAVQNVDMLSIMSAEERYTYARTNIAYRDKVRNSVVRYQPFTLDGSNTVGAMLAEGNTIYGYGASGLEELARQSGRESDFFRNGQFLMQGAKSAQLMANNAAIILEKAFKPLEIPLLDSILGDIRHIALNVDNVQAMDILNTLYLRNKLVDNLMAEISVDDFHRLCFFSPRNKSLSLLGKVYPEDGSRTVFLNVGQEFWLSHKIILHEVSHFASTDDFIYLAPPSGMGLSPAEPTIARLELLKRPDNLVDFKNSVPAYIIKDLLDVGRDNAIFRAHYLAAFEIVNSPGFAAEILKNNADSYVEFIELLSQKYILNDDHSVSVNTAYQPRVRRDVSSATDDTAKEANLESITARRMLLELAFALSKS